MVKLRIAVSILVISCFALKSQSETKASIALQNLTFISPDFDNPNKSNFTFLGATLKSSQKRPDSFRVDLDGYYAVGNSALSYLNIREIYFTFEPEVNSHFYIGRKLNDWSSLDTDWNLGFFQPQFRANPLDPQNQGLFGLFWDHEQDFWKVSLFASPFFLPDQGPSYEIKEGQFESSSPWFHSPPPRIKFQGQILPIDYNINRPETEDVVLRSVYALKLHAGQRRGFYADAAAAYKPAQQFALGYTGVLVTNRVKIDITPVAYNENLYAADVGYRDDWGLAQFSLLQTKPMQPYFKNSDNKPVLSDSLSFGPKLVYNFRPFQFELSYLTTQGGQVSETGPDSSSDRMSLTQRFLFREAAQLKAKYSQIFYNQFKLDSEIEYRFSSADQFKQLRLKNKLDLRGPWCFWSDLILIDTADDAKLNMNTFRNLDQFWIGASYDI